MIRSTAMFLRTALVLFTCSMLGIFAYFALPLDRNIIDLKICLTAFVVPYFLMAALTVLFTRTRKFDLALTTAATVGTVLVGQVGMSLLISSPMPQIAQGLSSAVGILCYILPMCVAKFRGEVRNDMYITKFVATRRMIGSSTIGTPLVRN
jgi:hypothetical protein